MNVRPPTTRCGSGGGSPPSRSGTRSSAPERMNTSPLAASSYSGRPFEVLRVICGNETLQPRPKGPFPAPELYARLSFGPKPLRPGDTNTPSVNDAVPVARFTASFSSMPLIAPPPLGSETEGRTTGGFCSSEPPAGDSRGDEENHHSRFSCSAIVVHPNPGAADCRSAGTHVKILFESS